MVRPGRVVYAGAIKRATVNSNHVSRRMKNVCQTSE